ncbi:MAG TPA: TonB family protein [Candidatus Solibacter sp.]|nr:TonB family protein [Candidatus Solibacter sp.]
MAPMSKDHEILTAPPDSATAAGVPPGGRLEDTASRPQPVALEVPVTVNGARTVEGSDKREPFSETTKTVLVFGNGAVIRLGSPVAAGQLLFLTNEKTKKEVVCQVVKSKNYRNVSGYVELEFTESVVGFWGMRFPSDRIGAQTPVPPVKTPVPTKSVAGPPAATRSTIVAPVPSAAPKIPLASPIAVHDEMKPPQQTRPSDPVALAPIVPKLEAPSMQPPAAATPAEKMPELAAMPAPSISASLTSSVVSLLGVPEVQASPTSTSPAAPPISIESKATHANVAADSTEELKLQTARLQEQLSSMLFNPAADARPAPTSQTPPSHASAEAASKVIEIAKSELPLLKTAPPTRTPSAIKSSLDSEEVKIPSWLEPLARNAAAAAPPTESVEKEKSKLTLEFTEAEEHSTETAPAAETESALANEQPGVESLLSLDDVLTSRDHSSGGSRKGMWIGMIAAAVLVAASGAWYAFNSSNALRGRSAPVSPASSAQANAMPSQNPEARPEEHSASRNPLTEADLTSRSTAPPRSNSTSSSEAFLKSLGNPQPTQSTRENTGEAASTIPAAVTERISRTKREPEPKKPALGEVHLSSPTMNRAETGQDSGAVAPTISAGNANAGSGGFESGLAAGSEKQPAAPEIPLPVGGDVKPARLISHVAPLYPIMAKNQHVTGDVVIDALIDPNGRVTTMKVISGPTLLHQAAKDALHQWKYQPASLDGKPVAMHLTVTLQFRMQ